MGDLKPSLMRIVELGEEGLKVCKAVPINVFEPDMH